MAVTFIQQPDEKSIQSSDNPINYVFSSDQTTQANFCFIVQTFIGNVLVSTDKVFPERGNRAHWDAGKIAMNFTKAFPRPTDLIVPRALPTMYIKVAERYGTTPSTQPFETSLTHYVVKARCTEERYKPNWIQDDYVIESQWITDAPNKTLIVSKKHPIYASIFNQGATILVEAYCYAENGDLLGIVNDTSIQGMQRVDVCITPDAIQNEIAPASIDDVARMEVYMNQSEPLFVTFVPNECTEFNQVNWLNNLGTYDQFLFGHNHEQESAITMLEYKKQFGSWGTSNEFNYDSLTSGDTTYTKTIQPTGTLYTGWISEVYQNWLANIYYSIGVLLYAEDGTHAISVTDTKATKMQSRFDELLNFQVGYSKTNFKSITQ